MKFYVYEATKADDGMLLDGRCLTGTVSKGAVFDKVEIAPPPASSTSSHARKVWEGAALRVRSIQAYGKEIDSITEGLTARLAVTGQLSLGKGDVLIGDDV